MNCGLKKNYYRKKFGRVSLQLMPINRFEIIFFLLSFFLFDDLNRLLSVIKAFITKILLLQNSELSDKFFENVIISFLL